MHRICAEQGVSVQAARGHWARQYDPETKPWRRGSLRSQDVTDFLSSSTMRWEGRHTLTPLSCSWNSVYQVQSIPIPPQIGHNLWIPCSPSFLKSAQWGSFQSCHGFWTCYDLRISQAASQLYLNSHSMCCDARCDGRSSPTETTKLVRT
jgi:hypothetical protein